MKVYRAKDNGSKVTVQQFDGAWNYNDKKEKSIEQYAGDGSWKWLHGVKLMVDPAGLVIKGPDIFISRKYDDVKNLSYADTFTVMRSVARATGATNKAIEMPEDKEAKEKAWQEAVDLMDTLIETRKQHEKDKTKYLTPSNE